MQSVWLASSIRGQNRGTERSIAATGRDPDTLADSPQGSLDVSLYLMLIVCWLQEVLYKPVLQVSQEGGKKNLKENSNTVDTCEKGFHKV